jgi:hypothetical protein
MENLLVSLLPFILGSAFLPIPLIIMVLLLKSNNRGLLKALAYVSGMTIVRLLQGVIFGLILAEGVAESAEDNGGQSPVVSILLLVLGLLLLITAYRKWRKEEDPDDPPPKWLTMIDNLTPLMALGAGMGLLLINAKFWVFTLSAISVIAQAELGQPTSTIAYLLFVGLAQSLLLLALLMRVILPGRSKLLLESTSVWLTANNRTILIVVSLVFGIFFLYQGASALLLYG